MGLKGLKLPETSIPVPGGDKIVVRGLSLEDIMSLARTHAPAMRAFFTSVSGSDGLAGLDISTVGAEVLQVAPTLAAEIIALGAGEPDAVDVARTLPAPLQLECLEAIGLHTVETSGGLKKVVETVIRVAQATTGALTSLRKA